MRINNNLPAINTHRQLGISQNQGNKSMEKLSSGFRINRAGDDAAGLAISEKMRGQIRGLTQASRNSQDAISLIQTAEGALGETHAIIQRMRELAVQAANGTYAQADIQAIQDEMNQLKAEVDRIGNTTEFNTKKLLEGSARGIANEVAGSLRINNNSGVVINSDDEKAMRASIANDKSFAFDGAFMLVKVNQTKDSGVSVYNANDFRLVGPDGKAFEFVEISNNQSVEASKLTAGTIIADGGRVFEGNDARLDTVGQLVAGTTSGVNGTHNLTLGAAVNHTVVNTLGSASTLASGSSVTIKSDQQVTLSTAGGAAAIRYTADGKMVLLGSASNSASVVATIEVGRSVTLNNGTVIRNDGGGTFTVASGNLALGTAGMTTFGNYSQVSAFTLASQSTLGSASVLTNAANTTLVQATYYSVGTAGAFNVNVTIGNSAGLTDVDITLMKAGTVLARGSNLTIADDSFITLNVNGKELQVSYEDNVMKVGNQIVAAGKSITLADGTVLTHSTNLSTSSADAALATGRITVTSGKITLAKDVGSVNTVGGTVNNTRDYYIAKDSTLAAGSRAATETHLMAGTVFTNPGTNFAGSVTLAHGGSGMQFSANAGNSLEASFFEKAVGDKMTFVFSKYVAASNSINDSVMVQAGANSGQTTWLSMGDMRSKALGIDKVDVTTQWGAAVGIETINNALQKVSNQRSALGAMQNRLEHTIKNLDTAAENLQASESRIRDVDMAREIMDYTKNTILQQASQAMLAQANQAPQSIMQLLR